MSDVKHTPGPWNIHRCSNAGERDACGIFNADWEGPDKSSYPNIVCDASYDECHHVMTLADARLIAAAPDLLEALKAAQSILWMAEQYAESGGLNGPEMRDFKEAEPLIYAAIRKAEAQQ